MNAFAKSTYKLVPLFLLLMISGCAFGIGDWGEGMHMAPRPLYPPSSQRERWGYITVHSVPSDASVYLNNRYIGNTPIDGLRIKSRTYKLEITKDGYDSHMETIWVVGDPKESKFHVILRKR